MNQPSDHANAAWRTPGGATPQAIEGAIIAFNKELIGEIDALREKLRIVNANYQSISGQIQRRGRDIVFDIQHFGERAAGLAPWTDVITINVRDGAIDGIEGEFVEAIQPALAGFFDGCTVTVAHPDPTKE